MISSDEASGNALFNWQNKRTPLKVDLTVGPIAFEGRGTLLRFDDDGMDIGLSDFWRIAIVFDADVVLSTAFPADTPDRVVVLVTAGSLRFSLTGERPIVSARSGVVWHRRTSRVVESQCALKNGSRPGSSRAFLLFHGSIPREVRLCPTLQ